MFCINCFTSCLGRIWVFNRFKKIYRETLSRFYRALRMEDQIPRHAQAQFPAEQRSQSCSRALPRALARLRRACRRPGLGAAFCATGCRPPKYGQAVTVINSRSRAPGRPRGSLDPKRRRILRRIVRTGTGLPAWRPGQLTRAAADFAARPPAADGNTRWITATMACGSAAEPGGSIANSHSPGGCSATGRRKRCREDAVIERVKRKRCTNVRHPLFAHARKLSQSREAGNSADEVFSGGDMAYHAAPGSDHRLLTSRLRSLHQTSRPSAPDS
jgi:hypothetical protein